MPIPQSDQVENRFYVYVLFRPDGRPCYVGKGKGERIGQHARLGGRHVNKHLSRIIKSAGGDLPGVKVVEDVSEAEALNTEKEFIRAIGRELHGGPLVNLTDGGEGLSGYKTPPEVIEKRRIMSLFITEDTRAKLSANLRQRGQHENAIAALKAANFGRVFSAETRAKIGAASRKKTMSPEARAKLSAAFTGKRAAAATCAKISAGLTGRKRAPFSEEHKKKLSEANIRRWARLKVATATGEK